jgi:hypothetical protein
MSSSVTVRCNSSFDMFDFLSFVLWWTPLDARDEIVAARPLCG